MINIFGTFIAFFLSFFMPNTRMKTMFKKIAKTPSIKIVLTNKFVCCTVLALAFTLVLNCTSLNIAESKKATLQYVTILEKNCKAIF